MIELTLDQVRALAQAGDRPTVIDPTTRTAYALVPLDEMPGGSAGAGAGARAHGRQTDGPTETPVEPWKHLVIREHPWRKQLFLKGRNMTVRQLVGTVRASGFTEEEAAKDLHLPVEAVREALRYFDENPEVIALDAAYEQYLRKLHGVGRGPQSVPR